MVKVSKESGRKNHADIVQAASVSIRRCGAAQTSIAQIAKAAGLTHGALYRHFLDKDALVAAAVESAFDTIVGLLAKLKLGGSDETAYAETYLTRDHRDHFDWGCPVAPLAAEMPRLPDNVQSAFCAGLKRNLDALAALIEPKESELAEEKAIMMLSALAGAMALSRAVKSTDARLSDRILETVRLGLSNAA
jgi:TetR/AcrR family transcriptional regulator, transcriptional repressor for nem operon